VPSREDARRLDRALGTGDVLSSFLPQNDEVSIAEYFERVRVLEQQETVIHEFALAYFPGIQAERYARAVLGAAFPPVSDEECDRRVLTRLERARILEDEEFQGGAGESQLLCLCPQVRCGLALGDPVDVGRRGTQACTP
jgi:hypothetical protein